MNIGIRYGIGIVYMTYDISISVMIYLHKC